MKKLKKLNEALWNLASEIEVEAERYDDLSEDILKMAQGLFDEERRILPPEAFEKYLQITRAQPGIRLSVNTECLTVERDLLVCSISNPTVKSVVRSLSPFTFTPVSEEDKNLLTFFNILYEEFESTAVHHNLPPPLVSSHYITLPQFKYFLSLLNNWVKVI
ncbi:hypothetical protein EFA69_19030 [Rufibacter immobilis]|uniref:Uncharacterized protein n=1 Tax=Rufibacter immobilis TaxID=1348778 RepID=A0A3M9MSI5_9BACT|nr:hypothetical protein [Rufibacter immobilis]RNI28167.1 hypothetical protein EFA69_19030 [Rufibacter immobilis]